MARLDPSRFPWFDERQALNQHLGVVTRTIPLFSTTGGQFATGDVLFCNAEIENAVPVAGGTSRLIGISIHNKDDENALQDTLFHQVNSYTLGTTNAAVDISDDDFRAMKHLGLHYTHSNDWKSIVNGYYYTTGSNSDEKGPSILLQAETGSTSVYFSVILRDNPTFASISDLQYIFHIEYR